jgi:hypothetical protein
MLRKLLRLLGFFILTDLQVFVVRIHKSLTSYRKYLGFLALSQPPPPKYWLSDCMLQYIVRLTQVSNLMYLPKH